MMIEIAPTGLIDALKSFRLFCSFLLLRCDGYWIPAARSQVLRRFEYEDVFSFVLVFSVRPDDNHGLKVKKLSRVVSYW